MPQVSEEDRQKDKAGREAMKKLSVPIKGRTRIAQVLTVASAMLAFVPYLALVKLGDVFLDASTGNYPLDTRQVENTVSLLVMFFLTKMTLYVLALSITHFADVKLRVLIRERIAERLSSVPLAWFDNHDSGSIRNAVQDDTRVVHTVIAHAPVDLVNGALTPLVLLIFMFVINWKLALVGVVTVPIYMLLYGSSMKDMGPKTAEMNTHLAEVSSMMVELVSGIKVVKAFSKVGEAHDNYQNAAKGFADSYWAWCEPLIGLCSIAQEFVSIPVILLVNLGGGGLLCSAGLATVPQLLACTLIAVVLPNAMTTVSNIVWSYQTAGAAAIRLCELMEVDTLPQADCPQLPEGNLDIEVDGVSYSYGETNALSQLSLTLKPNTVTALIGPSGSGKSTLATLIARFDDPDEGVIRLGGIDLRQIDTNELYRYVSFVLQDSMLLTTSIRRNISLACPGASLEEVRRAAQIAQIDNYIMSLPKGYDSVLGSDCQLSGGEGQRVAIARAILTDAPILIMDEATAFADPDSEVEIQRALRNLIQGRTVLVIAHRLNSILGADQIAVMERGHIVALGTHQELLNNGHYQALLQQSGFENFLSAKESDIYA